MQELQPPLLVYSQIKICRLCDKTTKYANMPKWFTMSVICERNQIRLLNKLDVIENMGCVFDTFSTIFKEIV